MVRLPVRSLALAAVVLAAAAPAAVPLLRYDRDLILHREVWRIVTGHLVHGSIDHLLWNVLPLICIGFLFEHSLGDRFWKILALSCVLVGGGLIVFDPGRATYLGLSGALNGLWVGGALLAARQEILTGSRSVALLYRICVFADIGKIAFETTSGTSLFTDPNKLGGDPVPVAHALGAIAGIICAAWWAQNGRVKPMLDSINFDRRRSRAAALPLADLRSILADPGPFSGLPPELGGGSTAPAGGLTSEPATCGGATASSRSQSVVSSKLPDHVRTLRLAV